jgi:hypothetical protein
MVDLSKSRMTDINGLLFRKTKINDRSVLVPSGLHSEEWLNDCEIGRDVLLTGRRPRNPDHHRLLFAVLRIVIDNTDDKWESEEDLLQDLKEATGLAKKKENPLTGMQTTRTGSISYAAMDQAKFKIWFDKVILVLATQVLQCKPQTLIDEVFEMAHGSKKQAWKYQRS